MTTDRWAAMRAAAKMDKMAYFNRDVFAALLAERDALREAAQNALDRMECAWSDADGGGPMFNLDDMAKLRAALALDKETP
jgi:hypothetical protein